MLVDNYLRLVLTIAVVTAFIWCIGIIANHLP